jgi:hypothetical protein
MGSSIVRIPKEKLRIKAGAIKNGLIYSEPIIERLRRRFESIIKKIG